MFENIEALTSTIINEEVNGNLQVYAPCGEDGTIFMFCPVFGGKPDYSIALTGFREFRYRRVGDWGVMNDLMSGMRSFAEDPIDDPSLWFDMEADAFTLTRVSDKSGTYYVAEAKDKWEIVFDHVGVYTRVY